MIKSFYCIKKKAFTLSEALITLGIIGVVASITLPSLISDYKVKQTVTQLKKINTTLQNMFTYTKINDFAGADFKDWDASEEEIINLFAKNMNTIKVCPKRLITECFPNINYKNLAGNVNVLSPNSLDGGMILNDGTSLGITIIDKGSEHIEITGDYGQIFVDLNGRKGPNILGRDVFSFIIRNSNLTARGTLRDGYSPYLNSSTYCSKTSGAGHNGLGCTAWVIYNENMDYLKCEGLNWHTKLKCN